MVTKKSKQQREQEARDALRQRIADILIGATGGEDVYDESFWLTLDGAQRAIPALRSVFGNEQNDYLWLPHCLSYFETLDSTTKHLWGAGIRAK